jgi:hypothetical protein
MTIQEGLSANKHRQGRPTHQYQVYSTRSVKGNPERAAFGVRPGTDAEQLEVPFTPNPFPSLEKCKP